MNRLQEMYKLRETSATFYRDLKEEKQTPNGDEQEFPDLRATFTKSLPHDATTGLADPVAFKTLYNDIDDIEPAPSTFNPFVDPQAGLAYDTEGPDAHQLALPAPPKFTSDQEIAEIAESYWMALLRDVPFANYTIPDPLVTSAVNHLKTLVGYENVTPGTLFRGPLEFEELGPYLSQFMVWDVPYGSQMTPAKVAFGLPDGQDYMTDWASWLAVQNGVAQPTPPVAPITPRYITRGRDIAQYVHIDELFQAYLNACLILITPTKRGGFAGIADQGNPYVGAVSTGAAAVARHCNQVGFGTLGEPNFKTMVAEVATRALKQVWHQKWFVHRRLRPEAFGGRLEAQRTGAVSNFISAAHITKLQPVLDEVFAKNGNWLLPQAFPEGCPVHPAYGAGHATVAGACITVLKALFYENAKLSDLGIAPLMIDANGNQVPYTGADAGQLTVLSELNKLASNVGLARNIAGVHWRTDYTESLVMGERIALYFLQEYVNTYHEDVTFSVRTFGRENVTIQKGKHHHFDAYALPATMAMHA